MNDAREQAESAAVRIRAELLSTLRELDRRRRRAFDLKYQIDKHFTLVVALAGGVLAAAGMALAIALMRAKMRRENLFAERIRGLMRAWENPHRIPRFGPAPLMSAATARRIAAGLALTLATELARRSAQRLLPSNSSR
jgi:hypothetical protein